MTAPVDPRTGKIDYELAVNLDAEDLAEFGVATAYEELRPHITSFGVDLEPITEDIDDATGAYYVRHGDTTYPIFGDGIDPRDSWELAAFALFEIVNGQLARSPRLLFALNGGNDLFGILMSPAEMESARAALKDEKDWPYRPIAEPDWFGMFHGGAGRT